MTLDPKTWWYVTRATGFVSWALLAVAVLWGLFITNKTLHRTTAPAWVLDLHRHLGGLAVAFVAVHLAALPLDGFTHWGWSDLFVPMSSTWHPGAVAWGIVGMYLLVAIELTSLLGRRFPKKWWRRVHMLSFPLYVLASIHLFAAGTDSSNVVVTWMVVTTSTLIVFLTVVRALAAAKPRETRANPRTTAARAHALRTTAQSDARARATANPTAPTLAGDLLPSTSAISAPGRPSLQVRLGAPTLADRITRLHEQTAAAASHSCDVTPVS